VSRRGPAGYRHWFVIAGDPPLRLPVCGACGEPNPRPLDDGEWAALIAFREETWQKPPAGVEAAIAARKAEQP
jgi:hypothetical protein